MSPAALIAVRLVTEIGRERSHRAIDMILDQMDVVDAAALAYDWPFWARPKQLAPVGEWRSWGGLAARGFGKTYAISKFINEEVEAGRAPLIGLAAQDEANAVSIQVLGPSGLIATAPPWFRPRWEATGLQLVWPDGSRAYVRTPMVPGKIRGLEYHLSWLSEIQSWPVEMREEAYSNFLLSTRLGLARIVWDATPKKAHPILKDLLADAEREPERHFIIRGTTRENAINLAAGYVETLERKYGGTQKGREELLGEMLEESDNAVAKQAWIDAARRPMPPTLVRRGIGVDPAVTARRSSDRTGIIEAGLGSDGQGYVLGDQSGRHEAHAWAKIVLDTYTKNRCDFVVVETNRGGSLVTQVLRSAAQARGLEVIVVGEKERPPHRPKIVYVREVYASGEKLDRAQPIATAYERKRISHVLGVDLLSLEETLTTWEPTPGGRSPDDLDALTHVMKELLDLVNPTTDPKVGFKGLVAAGRRLTSPTPTPALADLLGRGRGGRI